MSRNFDEILAGLAKDCGKGVYGAYRTMRETLEKNGETDSLTLDDFAYIIVEYGPDETLGALLACVYEHVEMHRILDMSEAELDEVIRARGEDPTEVAQRARMRAMFILGNKKAIKEGMIKNE